MRVPVKTCVAIAVVAAVAASSYRPVRESWKSRNRPNYRSAPVVQGRIVSVVNSTGTVEPVLKVQIGSFVSGPIVELGVDFNDRVKKGDLLARIDPRIYKAAVARDRATLATRRADVDRVRALLQQALNDEDRSKALHAENEDYISGTEMDQFHFNRLSLEAQLMVAEAAVEQARASLENSDANLEYTEIRSPVDGTVIDKKIDPGQTLAAQFQTPELFVIAPDMEKEMYVFASVDEADIGLIRDAQRRGEAVFFTVDAYPGERFKGRIRQIRVSPTTTQNVVTYPVVVSAANAELKLLPGMTASLSFQIEAKEDVLKIPNAALRFYPERDQVRTEDRELLDGAEWEDQQEVGTGVTVVSATERAEADRRRGRRHVWILEGEHLRAVEVETGIHDGKFTELASGHLRAEQALVTGIRSKSQQ